MGDKRKAESVADAAVVKTKRSKKSKVDKKPKKESRQRTDKGETAPVAQDDAKAIGDEGRKSSTEDLDRSHTAETASSLKKSTKTKKAKKATSRTSDQEDESHSSADAGASSQTQGEEGAASKGKPARFIVFVGNLPFGTTQEQVQEHFAKIKPSQVRLATEKDSKKSRGFAFVEFDHYDRMKTCLKLYHHSLMDDGKGNSRKINCELR
ncbi:hypothetical protein KEM52_005993 [Ascosphaera acerosa]|nr:hypothetical protein KEM52_005993 [Ascosphaera acerosa]